MKGRLGKSVFVSVCVEGKKRQRDVKFFWEEEELKENMLTCIYPSFWGAMHDIPLIGNPGTGYWVYSRSKFNIFKNPSNLAVSLHVALNHRISCDGFGVAPRPNRDADK